MHRAISSTLAGEGRLGCGTAGVSGILFRQTSAHAMRRPRTPQSISGAMGSNRSLSLEQRRGMFPKRTRMQPKSTLAIHNSTSALPSEKPLRRPAQLSWQQIQSISLSSAIPMVGFGFMDNFIMIQAGSVIDNTLGVKFGLATLTAAALGQVVSDTCGVLFGGTLERLMVVPPAKLTEAQKRLAVIPRLRLAAAVVGVIVGCSLGACTLYFLPDNQRNGEAESLSTSRGTKRTEAMQRLQGVVNELFTNVNEPWIERGTSCTLYVNQPVAWNSPSSQDLPVTIASIAQLSGGVESMVVQCVEACKLLVNENTIYVPIMDKQQNVVLGVLKLAQRDDRRNEAPFSEAETEEAKKLARLVGIFMGHMTHLR